MLVAYVPPRYCRQLGGLPASPTMQTFRNAIIHGSGLCHLPDMRLLLYYLDLALAAPSSIWLRHSHE